MAELEPQNNERVDQAGAVASTLCAIHCAICALLPAAFGALGLGMLLSQTAEWAFTLVAVSIAAGALVLSWRQYRSIAVAGLLSLGIVGLLASRVLEMGSDHHHHGEHHADHHGEGHHDEVAHAEDEHHDSTAEKHEDHHDEGHDEGHVADRHEHEDHSSEKHHEHPKEGHHDEHEHNDHEGEEESHDDDNHTLGASVGIAGGILLLFGHMLNIGTSRKRQTTTEEECCD